MATIIDISNSVSDLIPVKRSASVIGSDVKAAKLMAACILVELNNIHQSHDWKVNVKEFQIVATTTSKNDFTLPSDFVAVVPDTMWTSRNNLKIDSMSRQGMAYSDFNGLVKTGITNYFKTLESNTSQTINFHIDLTVGETVKFFYKTNATCKSSANVELPKPTNDTDILIYNESLVRIAVLKSMLIRLGLDAQYEIAEYARLLTLEKANNLDAGKVSIGGSGRRVGVNIPDTGYGV